MWSRKSPPQHSTRFPADVSSGDVRNQEVQASSNAPWLWSGGCSLQGSPPKKTKLVSRTHRTMGFIDVYSKYIMIYTYVYTYICFFSQDLFRVFVLRRYILGDTAKDIRQAAYEVPCRNHGSHGTDKENEDLLCFKHGDWFSIVIWSTIV